MSTAHTLLNTSTASPLQQPQRLTRLTLSAAAFLLNFSFSLSDSSLHCSPMILAISVTLASGFSSLTCRSWVHIRKHSQMLPWSGCTHAQHITQRTGPHDDVLPTACGVSWLAWSQCASARKQQEPHSISQEDVLKDVLHAGIARRVLRALWIAQ